MSKRIINCAITGSIHTPSMSPYLPITPDEIAQNAIDAANAGAAAVHIHARNPENGAPSPSLDLFKEIIDKIRAKNQDVIICLTTGGGVGMTVEERPVRSARSSWAAELITTCRILGRLGGNAIRMKSQPVLIKNRVRSQ